MASGIADEERLTGLGDTAGDSATDRRREQLHRVAGVGSDEIAAKGHWQELVVLAEEHTAVVVIDEEPELVGDRQPDLRDVVEARELSGEALQHLQVRDRAAIVAADALLGGALALAHVEGDDEALAARLRGHHGDLRARDELARIGRVLGPDRDTGGDRQLSDGLGLERRELLADPFRERRRAVDVSRGKDHRELFTAHSADDVAHTNGRSEDVGDLLEEVVADPVSVDVVDLLEVVEIEHHHGDRLACSRRAQELLSETVVEGTVVVEAGQSVRLGLMLEPGTDVRVVDCQCGGVAEALREEELLVRERGVLADAIDVQRALELPAGDKRDCDQRLGLDRRAGNEAHTRVEVRLVREDGLAMVDRPAGDSLSERERLAHDLVGPVAPCEYGTELSIRLVRLVDVDVLVGDQLRERVRDALEQSVEALLGEHVVEDLGQAPIRLGRAARHEADLGPGCRIDGCRVGHAASFLIGRRRTRLESASAKIPRP